MGWRPRALATNKDMTNKSSSVKAEQDRAKASRRCAEVMDAAAGQNGGGATRRNRFVLQADTEAQGQPSQPTWSILPQYGFRSQRCAKARLPVLAINAKRIGRWILSKNLPHDRRGAQGRGGKNNRERSRSRIPRIEYSLQHCRPAAKGEYVTIDETVAPEELELMSSWIAERTKKLAANRLMRFKREARIG